MKQRELLFSLTAKDFRVDTYKASGNGGQHRNKTESAVRITHPESGAVGNCSDHREQSRNKKEAFRRLVESDKFKVWHKRKCAQMALERDNQKSIEQLAEESMKDRNLKVEVKDEKGRWVLLDNN